MLPEFAYRSASFAVYGSTVLVRCSAHDCPASPVPMREEQTAWRSLWERSGMSREDSPPPDSIRRRVVRNAPSSSGQQPVRHLGIDDWAWRKHQNDGTILVDLDGHKVVDLLPDRAADSVAQWLKEHTGVEIVARDRSGLYADGAAAGAPQAVQVAGRFHLMLNLSAAIERVLEGCSRQLLLPAQDPVSPTPVAPEPESTLTAQKRLQVERRQRRLLRHEQVKELHSRGYSQLAISRELAIGRKTVRRWLRTDQFPERKSPVGRRKKVAEVSPIFKRTMECWLSQRDAVAMKKFALAATRDPGRWHQWRLPGGLHHKTG